MARFLHTADWHLGRPFFGASLLSDQEQVLEQLVDLACRERVDCLLIAGDVFDRAVPPAEAVSLLDATLTALVERARCQVVLIAGNHDSPRRLDFCRHLVRQGGLHICGTPQLPPPVLTVPDRWGGVQVWPVPFLEPGRARELLGEQDLAGADAALGAYLAAGEPTPRSLLVTHAFLAGGTTCESERPLVVGGAEAVDPRRCSPYLYTALGHLHRPQWVGPDHSIRYSGSLLQYSFDEVDQEKGVTLLEIEESGLTRVEHIPLAPRRPLRVLTGRLEELLTLAEREGGHGDYLLVRLTDRGPAVNAAERLRVHYPNLMHLERELPITGAGEVEDLAATLALDDRALFQAFFTAVAGEPMEPAEVEVLDRTLEQLARERRESAG